MFVNALMGRAALKRSRRFLSIATSKTGEAEIAGMLTFIEVIAKTITGS